MTAKKMCTHLHEYVIKPLNEKYDRVIITNLNLCNSHLCESNIKDNVDNNLS